MPSQTKTKRAGMPNVRTKIDHSATRMVLTISACTEAVCWKTRQDVNAILRQNPWATIFVKNYMS